MPVGTYVDTEEAVKAWARSKANITTAAPGGVFLSIPKGATFPLLTIQRVAGSPDPSEVPLDQARFQFDCWGGSRKQAAELARQVVAAVVAVKDDAMGSVAIAKGAVIELGPVFQPDQQSRRARYLVDALFCLVSVA